MNYEEYKEKSISGRYITLEHITPLLKSLSDRFELSIIGTSVKGEDIPMVKVGSGAYKVLAWSQMHGNESTTTKALIDFFRFLSGQEELGMAILNGFTVYVIPILNPDGAKAYTRVNANQVDLNRDAQNLTEPESQVLRSVYNTFKPDLCLNLHGQRTIFNVGTTPKPATVSFLSPAFDEARGISESRLMAMKLICAMNNDLQKIIPGQVGRYDDGFNPNCVGDAFQMQNVPTILFEAGHYPQDYDREVTRKLIFNSYLSLFESLIRNTYNVYRQSDYQEIPENGKYFFDILIKNIGQLEDRYEKYDSVGIMYVETLINGKIVFKPTVTQQKVENHHVGHKLFDCSKSTDRELLMNLPEILSLLH
jgi:hypothetical protein